MERYTGIEAFKMMIEGMGIPELLIRRKEYTDRVNLIDRALIEQGYKGKEVTREILDTPPKA